MIENQAPKQPEKRPKTIQEMTWEEKCQEEANWALLFNKIRYDRWNTALLLDMQRNPGDYIR